MNIGPNTELYLSVGTIIGLIGFAIYWSVKFTSAKDKIIYRICNLEEKEQAATVERNLLRDKSNLTDISITRMEGKIDNMYAMLLEIKESMK